VTIRLANDESIFDVAKLVGTSVAMIDQTYGHIYRQKQQAAATDYIASVLYGA